MINWIFFPKSTPAPEVVQSVVQAFKTAEPELQKRAQDLTSDVVLAIVRPGLQQAGFQVETGKKANQKIHVPVLFGRNGAVEKAFDADAWHRASRMVMEVEAGRGYTNNQFLKDLFQACMMHDVDYCGIAVRNIYIDSKDFEAVVNFLETLYASERLKLPLKGVLILGY